MTKRLQIQHKETQAEYIQRLETALADREHAIELLTMRTPKAQRLKDYERGYEQGVQYMIEFISDPNSNYETVRAVLALWERAREVLLVAQGQAVLKRMVELHGEYSGLVSRYFAMHKAYYDERYGTQGEIVKQGDLRYTSTWNTLQRYLAAWDRVFSGDLAPIRELLSQRFKEDILQKAQAYPRPGKPAGITTWRQELGKRSIAIGNDLQPKQKILALLRELATEEKAEEHNAQWVLRPGYQDLPDEQHMFKSLLKARTSSERNSGHASKYISELEREYRRTLLG